MLIIIHITQILITLKDIPECEISPLFLQPTHALQTSFLFHFFIFSALVLLAPLPSLLAAPAMSWCKLHTPAT
jgi:hypothetical protein